MSDAAIEVTGLCKSFEKGRIAALNGMDLRVEAGEFVALRRGHIEVVGIGEEGPVGFAVPLLAWFAGRGALPPARRTASRATPSSDSALRAASSSTTLPTRSASGYW